ncbi:MAG: acetyl-CoA carboxylase biotin carboxyl carrier protein [Aquificaceae bacterium]|nr:acetyl-CoA carboxylase biotin carboxyl carrier protein [Aquificaceae bacterium]MCS7277775.1 acetyl-CoA carboxylase biotin carboxyl carrier protein [Aquificaceae bacterium]MDW8066547.1 acetyl-CoA carboxylase biotin carboxyl carrier protein [Aquificaceae bacterium]MDW8423123.1 acetyl-CoA carboxylase biotin carboxyl carrier protein [Aquificaceae bacterium]
MDKDFIKEIINLIKGSDIRHLSLETEGFKLLIETHHKEIVQKMEPIQKELRYQEVMPTSEEIPQENLHVIKSPLVGTFYRSPSPGAPPFVEVGDIVSPGQVLCIVEALKVMNEIESDVRGKIVKILAENGETVEYGQPLFLIDTKA